MEAVSVKLNIWVYQVSRAAYTQHNIYWYIATLYYNGVKKLIILVVFGRLEEAEGEKGTVVAVRAEKAARAKARTLQYEGRGDTSAKDNPKFEATV